MSTSSFPVPADGAADTASGIPAGRLPNFLLAGVPKCGTTSLAAHLSRHPEIFMTTEKELHFFDRHWGNGVDWYRSQFALADRSLAGEATPTYVLNDESLDRLVETLGPVPLVIMVRHPVDRAYSHYWFNRWRDRRAFARAVDDELRGRGPRWGYISDGRYIEIVERVLARFSEDRVHVVLLDDLRREPVETVRGVLRFLGTGDHEVPAAVATVHNAAFRFRSHLVLYAMLGTRLWDWAPRVAQAIDGRNRVPLRPEPMNPAVRARLLEHYREPNRRFAEWLERDLSGWDR